MLKLKSPWSSVLAEATFLPEASLSSTVTPGRPFSPGSTLPGVPPPGLKSRHTVPAIPLLSGFAATACLAPEGMSVGGIAVSPIRATEPLCSGVFSVRPVFGSPMTLSVDGRASDSGPPGFQTSSKVFTIALTVPFDGSCWYISRQITPVANSEIAIGMNTTVLNATAQLTRSTSTAKISPIAVTSIGTTTTQMRLFLIAVWIVPLAEHRVVVVEPDEVLAARRRRSCARSCRSSAR